VSSEVRLAYQQGQRKKGNPERFTLLNRVPFGKFNKVNSAPVNAYDYNMIHLMPFLINVICCIYSFSAIDSSLFDKV